MDVVNHPFFVLNENMLYLSIDRMNSQPLFIQIRDQIINQIERGILKEGFHLPPSRELAGILKVNRTTVYKAYRELWSLGYTESRPGSYSVVRNRNSTKGIENKSSVRIDWDNLIGVHNISYKTAPVPDSLKFDFRTFSPASISDAVEKFRKCLNDVMKAKGSALLQYGDTYGYRPLREYISSIMGQNRIESDEGNTLITDGAQRALDLLCKLFRKENWTVVTSDPTYSEALSLFRFYGARIISIPMTSEGMNTEKMAKILKENLISFVYTMPNYQNPTGISSTQKNREEILNCCERAGVPIIEDGFSEDMRGTILPIKSMDKNGIVLYVGTFSKVLFPGIRTGWINGDAAIIKKLAALQYMSSVSGNILMQAALDRFCRLGYYDLHLKRIHKIYSRRMDKAMTVLKENFPCEAAEYTMPSGGYYLWFRFNKQFNSEEQLIRKLRESDILITGGSLFTNSISGVYLRMSLAHIADQKLEEGLMRFCNAVKEIL